MKDPIYFEQNRFDDIVADNLEVPVAPEMRDVAALAAEKIVEAGDFVAVTKQPLAQMRPKESRSTRHQRSHDSPPL
jgi:hypothetical protein